MVHFLSWNGQWSGQWNVASLLKHSFLLVLLFLARSVFSNKIWFHARLVMLCSILIATLSPLPLCLQVFGPTWTWQAVGKAGTRWGPEDACSSPCEYVEIKTAFSSLSYFMINVKKKKKFHLRIISRVAHSIFGRHWLLTVHDVSKKRNKNVWFDSDKSNVFLNTFSKVWHLLLLLILLLAWF